MARYITLKDPQERPAEATAWIPREKAAHKMQGPSGQAVASERLIKSSSQHTTRALLQKYGSVDALTQALIESDPEIDFERVGRKTGPSARIWVRDDHTALYAARSLEIIEDPSGVEIDRRKASPVAPTVLRERPLPWTGQLLPIETVVTRFALVKKLQLRHSSPAAYNVLYELARQLHETKRMALVGAGDKGQEPLIMQRGGSPHRGFLEGRVKDGAYLLVLHLSNLELRQGGPTS